MIARWPWLITLIVLIAIICVCVPDAIRTSMLRGAGWMLVESAPIQPGDVIVIAVGVDGAGTLEAADLVHKGLAEQVALFADPPDLTVENEFVRRGVPYERGAELPIRELRALGIENSEITPAMWAGSEDEGPALARWCDEHRYHSVIVVSMPDHTRRLRRMLRRAFAGHPTQVSVTARAFLCLTPINGGSPTTAREPRLKRGEAVARHRAPPVFVSECRFTFLLRWLACEQNNYWIASKKYQSRAGVSVTARDETATYV